MNARSDKAIGNLFIVGLFGLLGFAIGGWACAVLTTLAVLVGGMLQQEWDSLPEEEE